MDLKRTFVGYVFITTIAFSGILGISHGKDVDPTREISSAATRALKSVQKISKGVQGFSGGSSENFFDSRHLLAKKKSAPSCSWEDGECDVSDEKALKLLSSASSGIADFALQLLKCNIVTSKAKCSEPDCKWEDGECSAGDSILGPDAIKECMGDAAVFIEIDAKDSACEGLSSSARACNADEDCTWDDDENKCKFDIFKVLIGVPSVNGKPLGFNEVLEDYKNWLVATSIADGIASSEDLDEILEWDPVYECPDSTSQLLCDLVVGTQEVFVDAVYCGRKFPDGEFLAKDCDADPLCGVDEESKCTVSEEVESLVERRTLTAFVESVENPLIREILVPFLTCRGLTEADCLDGCSWDATSGECDTDGVELMQILGKTAKENPKPLCQLLGAVFQSGCISASATQCDSNQKCEIDEDGECGPRETVMQDAVLKGDAKFKKAFNKAAKVCKKKKTKGACQ